MSRIYHEGQRKLQRRFDSVRLADRLEKVTYRTQMTPEDREFIAGREMFFLATADAAGRPNCSYKGGDPGFVRTLDASTLVFPCYDGNGMFLSAGNVSVNPHVGMLFIDLTTGKRLRLNGTATLVDAEDFDPAYLDAQLIVKVAVREVFPNCPRYIHTYRRVALSQFVPREGVTTPEPAWKQFAWARDVLPDAAKQSQSSSADPEGESV
jgi:predicted pyridoxine 5'-phosphate oxidase superfamily flavin-nucleotide-binding protein